jgi:uncharacterized protein (TIGR04222 family)
MLTMRGPQFLLLFTLTAIVAYFVLKHLIASRERERWPGNQRVRDPYAIAFLRAGIDELVKVAALTLTLRGLLKIDASSLQTVNPSYAERVSPPIEKALLRACISPNKPAAITANSEVVAAANNYKQGLEALQLLANAEVRRARWGPVLTVILLLCGLAAAKILVALATGHPNIGFLIVLTLIVSVVMLRRISERRTAAGEAALEDLRHLFSSLKRQDTRTSADAPANATMLAAVYGVYALPTESVVVWSQLFAKPAGAGSSTSGDGGSSCGSSCGGGGCGGGCGGCGS